MADFIGDYSPPAGRFAIVVGQREDPDDSFPFQINHIIWEPAYWPASHRQVVRNIQDTLADCWPLRDLFECRVDSMDELHAQSVTFCSYQRAASSSSAEASGSGLNRSFNVRLGAGVYVPGRHATARRPTRPT